MSAEKFLAEPLLEAETRLLQVLPNPLSAKKIAQIGKLLEGTDLSLRPGIIDFCAAFLSLGPRDREAFEAAVGAERSSGGPT